MPHAEKPRPDRDQRFVFHPEDDKDYIHFRDAAAAPFDGAATRLHRRNAWWLAEAALLSYWQPDVALGRFRGAGFDDARALDRDGVQCYLATGMGGAIVAFRGTQPNDWRDILDDVKVPLVAWDRDGMAVHQGFREALDRVWPMLEPALDGLGSTPVWFTGHSLGAALATLAADRHGSPAGVVTLGLPRVGDERFCRAFDARYPGRSLRYVSDTDVVTRVPLPAPPLFPYGHVGSLRQIATDGSVAAGSPDSDGFFGDLIEGGGQLLEVITGLFERSLLHPPRLVLDHMPRGYAVDIWNDFVKNGD